MCFFFSSRRRHTRYIGDWSSDVCSSDLEVRIRLDTGEAFGVRLSFLALLASVGVSGVSYERQVTLPRNAKAAEKTRSEERRVGKEGRTRRRTAQSIEKNRMKEGVQTKKG